VGGGTTFLGRKGGGSPLNFDQARPMVTMDTSVAEYNEEN
jgi:hypothetical protein